VKVQKPTRDSINPLTGDVTVPHFNIIHAESELENVNIVISRSCTVILSPLLARGILLGHATESAFESLIQEDLIKTLINIALLGESMELNLRRRDCFNLVNLIKMRLKEVVSNRTNQHPDYTVEEHLDLITMLFEIKEFLMADLSYDHV
jgi:hypothetical protein